MRRSSAVSEPTKNASSNTFDGKVASMAGDTLAMSGKDGTEHSHTPAKDATLTCDGTACKPEDLKAGRAIGVTTKKDDRNVVTGVESLNKKTEFAQAS
jgi:hypothetical protein